MNIDKSYLSFSLAIIVLLCLFSARTAGAEERIERAYALDRDGKVYFEIRSGDVDVHSWNKNEVRIVVRKDAVIDVNHTKENISMVVSHPQSMRCEIFIPDQAHLRVQTASGRVKAGRIGGFVDVRTTSGDIAVASAASGARCKSISGNIHIEKSTGNADLKTTSGGIRLAGIKGSVKADTVSGKIEIEAFSRADEMEIQSISGNVKLRGELAPGGIYELNSHSGNVEIGLPPASGFDLRAETFSGNIHSDFELKLTGKIDRKKVQGTSGRGGARLSVSTFSGNIRITRW